MKLLVVRHADAGDRDEFAKTGQPDSERPLSAKGVAQARAVADALVGLAPEVERVVSSPLLRARQTAEILRKAYAAPAVVETDSLEPDARPRAFEKWLRARSEDVILCVGHEPHLSRLGAWLTTGEAAAFMDLRKGGAFRVDFADQPGKGKGLLRWFIGPRELGALAKG